MRTYPPELTQILKKATRVTVLTGAGVSQESGLRTFRDAQAGLWAQYQAGGFSHADSFCA